MKNYQDICRTFDVDTIGDIRWAHAVNARSHLDTALSDTSVHVVEGDVRFGPDGILTMAHERNEESGLSFQEWAQRCIESGKGIKVDWKEPVSFKRSISDYQKVLREAKVLFCNADILQGPGGGASLFSPAEFIGTAREAFPDAMLSLGWRTRYQPGLFYTPDMIEGMLSAVAGVSGLITFAVRACYVKDSWTILQRLLDDPWHSLTIWNNEPLGPGLLQWIHKNTDPRRCLYDLI